MTEEAPRTPAEPELTEAGLRFIRDEILRTMVASIATAKAETLAAFELSNQARLHSIAMLNAGSNHGALCLACAIVVALGERGVIDPNHVIWWATWMAENQPPASEPIVSATAARMLQNFARMFASIMESRPDGPTSRN